MEVMALDDFLTVKVSICCLLLLFFFHCWRAQLNTACQAKESVPLVPPLWYPAAMERLLDINCMKHVVIIEMYN